MVPLLWWPAYDAEHHVRLFHQRIIPAMVAEPGGESLGHGIVSQNIEQVHPIPIWDSKAVHVNRIYGCICISVLGTADGFCERSRMIDGVWPKQPPPGEMLPILSFCWSYYTA